MVIKYLPHICAQLVYSSCTVVVQCLTVQLLYKCRTNNVQELKKDIRYFGGKNELALRAIKGKTEQGWSNITFECQSRPAELLLPVGA